MVLKSRQPDASDEARNVEQPAQLSVNCGAHASLARPPRIVYAERIKEFIQHAGSGMLAKNCIAALSAFL
jgi:hypothetical protein